MNTDTEIKAMADRLRHLVNTTNDAARLFRDYAGDIPGVINPPTPDYRTGEETTRTFTQTIEEDEL